jgi:multiple sugar transport system permease protein
MHVAWWVPFAFLAPALAGLVAFRVVPIGIALAGGFFGTSLMGETVFRGLANYEGLFDDPSFWAGVRVTLVFNLLINPLQVALAILFALLTFRPTRFVVTFRTALSCEPKRSHNGPG